MPRQTQVKQADSVIIVMEFKMKILLLKIYSISILLLFLIFTVVGCSDLQDDIAPVPQLNIHGSEVFNPQSPSFHGKKVVDNKERFGECKQCHSADFNGGTSQVSCYSSGCHPYPTINVHENGIVDTSSPNFHAKFIADNLGGKMSACANCHGATYEGGYVSPSCATCHSTINVHQDGIVNPTSPNFHGKYIAANLGWDMRACGSCHAANYSGGIDAPSCLTCHKGAYGPEACNTCHGDFNDPTKIAPPRALNGSTSTNDPGVGAHVSHLYDNQLGSLIRCSTCHTVPSSVYAEGHLGNDGKAEIIFGRLSVQGGANPGFNFANNTCSNTYCHGNFTFYRDSAASIYQFVYTGATMTGNNASVIWNKVDDTQAECGSCHGLPPTGHISYAITACATCHYGVVDGNGNIIDKTKHINGVANVFGN